MYIGLNFVQALFINFVNFWMHIAVCELAIRVNRGTARILKLFNDIPGMSTDLERDIADFALFSSHQRLKFNHFGMFDVDSAMGFRMIVACALHLVYLVQFDYMNFLLFLELGVLLVSMHFHLAVLFIYRSLWIINRELLRIVNLSVHGATESTRVHELQYLYKRLLELNLRIVAIYDYQITLLMMSLLTMNIIFPFFTLVYTISLKNPVTIHVVLNFLQAMSISSLDFWLHFAVCELAMRRNEGTSRILKLFNDIPDMSTQLERCLAPEIRSVQLVGDTLQLLGPWSISVHLRCKDEKNPTLQMLGVLLVCMHFHLAVIFIYRSLWIVNRELLGLLVPEIRSVQLVGDTLQLQGPWSFSFHLRCKDEKNPTLQVVGWIRNHLERDCGLGRMDKHSGNRISNHTADF
ncbi:hypothetical protein ACLKA6_017305 [Drosophila palustris]